jgi:hypothetical protein
VVIVRAPVTERHRWRRGPQQPGASLRHHPWDRGVIQGA